MSENCPICGRKLDSTADLHHLIPKAKNGSKTETVKLHKICHQKIHSLFDENLLVKHYYTIEKLLDDEKIQKFVKWIANKPIDFHNKSIMSKQHKWKNRK